MKKTIINTDGALAIAAISAGLLVCSPDVQAADCNNTDKLTNVVTGALLDMSAPMTLANGGSYTAPSTACTNARTITIPVNAKVTISDPGGFDFSTNKIIMAAGSTLTYHCTGTCKFIIDAPAAGTTPSVNLVASGLGVTFDLSNGANPTRLNVNANSDITLTSATATGLTSPVAIAAGKTLTLVTLTSLTAVMPKNSKITTSAAVTTITRK